jgi:hypothetical protein
MSLIGAKLHVKLNDFDQKPDEKLRKDIIRYAKMRLSYEELENLSKDEIYKLCVEKIENDYKEWTASMPHNRVFETTTPLGVPVTFDELSSLELMSDIREKSTVIQTNSTAGTLLEMKGKIIATAEPPSECPLCFDEAPTWCCPKCHRMCCESCLREWFASNKKFCCPFYECGYSDITMCDDPEYRAFAKRRMFEEVRPISLEDVKAFFRELTDFYRFAAFITTLEKSFRVNPQHKLCNENIQAFFKVVIGNKPIRYFRNIPMFNSRRLIFEEEVNLMTNTRFALILLSYRDEIGIIQSRISEPLIPFRPLQPYRMSTMEKGFTQYLEGILSILTSLEKKEPSIHIEETIVTSVLGPFMFALCAYPDYTNASVEFTGYLKSTVCRTFKRLNITELHEMAKGPMREWLLNHLIHNTHDEKSQWYKPEKDVALDAIDHGYHFYEILKQGFDISRMTEEELKNIPIGRCSHDNCHGFYGESRKCTACGWYTCKICNAAYPPSTPHKCEKEDVDTFANITTNAKPCPWCFTYIFKKSGCDDMFCTECHRYFDWRTGSKIYEKRHNPEAELYESRNRSIIDYDYDHMYKWLDEEFKDKLSNLIVQEPNQPATVMTAEGPVRVQLPQPPSTPINTRIRQDLAEIHEIKSKLRSLLVRFNTITNWLEALNKDNVKIEDVVNRALFMVYTRMSGFKDGPMLYNHNSFGVSHDIVWMLEGVVEQRLFHERTMSNKPHKVDKLKTPNDYLRHAVGIVTMLNELKKAFETRLPLLNNLLRPISVTAIKDEMRDHSKYCFEHVVPCCKAFIENMEAILQNFIHEKWV